MKKIIILIFAAALVVGFSANLRAQWSADSKISVTDTNAALNENMGQCLAVSGDSVHALWFDKKTDSTAIYYRHSFDGGVTWGPVVRIAGFSKSVDLPSIAVNGATVHVAWRDNTNSPNAITYYKRSLDGGNTWGADVSLGVWYWWPSITCSGNLVFIALNDSHPNNTEVYCQRSTDNGTTWDTVVHQISNATGRSEDPSISAGGGFVHLVWNDNRTGIMQTWYRRSTDNGVTWGQETQFSNTTGFAYFPIVHVSGANVDVVWGERTINGSNFDIFFRQSTDFGTTWGAQQQLTHGESAAYPTIARDGANIHLVWGTFNGDMYYLHSGDGGATWDPAISLVSYATNKPTSPFIVVSPPMLHVIWLDAREGHPEIYYKNNPTGNPIANFNVPNAADFGNIKIGASKDTTLVLRNLGSITVSILKYSLFDPNNGFMLSDTSVHNINAYDSASVKVHFNPSMTQSYSGIITITTDESSSNSHGIMLTGAGVDGKLITQAICDFGDVKVGGMQDTTITLHNSGAAQLNITGYFLTDPSDGFVLLDTSAHTIAANGNEQIKVRFNAAKEQSYSATITITTDESALATHRILLSGTGVKTNIILSETQMDFGDVDTGSTAQKTFTIKNMGTLSATIDSLEIRSGTIFAIAPTQFPILIPSGGQNIVTILFSPRQVGLAQAELWMKTANNWSLTVTLTGNGIAKIDTTQSLVMTNSFLNLLEVTPNPASNNATLKIGVVNHLEDVKINFYDADGRLIQTQNIGALDEGMQSIPLILPQRSGISFLRITSSGEIIGTAEVVLVR